MKLVVSLFYLLAVLTAPILVNMSVGAISDSVVIMQVQTEGLTATEEYILLYNMTDSPKDITGWCLEYTAASDNPGSKKVCLNAAVGQTSIMIDAGGYKSLATDKFIEVNNFSIDFLLFMGGMASGGGHLRLFDDSDVEIDRVGWGTAVNPESHLPDGEKIAPSKHIKDEVLSRNINLAVLDTDDNFADFSSRSLIYPCPNIDTILSSEYFVDDYGQCVERFCPNLVDSFHEAPKGYYKPDGSEICLPVPIVLEDSAMFVTEVYPNAPSTDSGKEFIEIYNPNEAVIDLEGYVMQVGPSFTKEFVFSSGSIEPGQYKFFSDTETGIVLPNTTGVQIRLIAPAGNLVSETAAYSDADDDQSWALIGDQWEYTNQITPGATNKSYLEPEADEVLGVISVLASCPAGKFRNPDTNRCKNIETTGSQLTPCTAGKTRNPATNRCISASTAVSQLKPCASDEFRNPETNRCKKNSSSSSDLGPCPEGQERNSETNRCRKVTVLGNSDGGLPTITDVAVESTEGQINWGIIALAMTGTIGYMVYEWRSELGQRLNRLKRA